MKKSMRGACFGTQHLLNKELHRSGHKDKFFRMYNLENLLPFIKEIDKLKFIERQALCHNGQRRENTAEHSWHLAMTVIVFHSLVEKEVDLAKAVKMALLHDLVEIDAGDTFVYADLSGKKEKETQAINRLTALLPEPLDAEFKSLWLEFEEGVSAEAKFVGAIDRFLPLYSNFLNDGYSWKNHDVTEKKVYGRVEKPISEGFPPLWLIAKKMIEDSVKKSWIRTES